MIDALVLAGSPNTGALHGVSREPYEALIKIGPRRMINYVLNALQQSGQVGRIMVVGPAAVKEVLPPQVQWTAAGQSLTENIQRGCSQMNRPFLLVTSDIPLLTGEAVTGFVSLCGDRSLDFYFPLVPKEMITARFPGAKRTYIRFREGIFTGGNLFWVNPRVVDGCLGLARELVQLRKQPLALARRVGFSLLCKLLLRRLTLAEAEARAGRLLGIKGRAVICPYPEVGMDVDKPSDLQLVCRVLGYRQAGPAGTLPAP
ncbi:NTP transferase domain-containing protein [Desulforamulus hydrothermalis]|uniref:MobA-like NTP transferase domain-containing protein n=1 Tax=Desulforamulus hydrothermalis Lam5 = DSM 18033 TaxID=1121428 RepID=K8DZP7_9FIRM|nr:NTP transferase domain-containing protein [Desulforamulus hydrothermalis]CCO08604.1 conserved hypothetical protein [Desulforamulus hydrothermalis Lam5 = DSM 18033]SHH01349.1 MobA-like NTP transferase domain-containing protein [Desulforamulus hydrothermalis Lam5 = DSM 18033]